jgi:enterobacterial common antigen flippase
MNGTWVQIAETSAARIYGLLTGLLSLFITARVLGPEGQGILAAAIVWVRMFASFGGLSLGQVVQHSFQEKKSANWLPGTLGTLLTLCVIFTLLTCIVVFVIHLSSGGTFFKGIPPAVLAIGLIMLPFLIWEEYGSSLLALGNRLRTYNISQFVGKTVGLVALIILIVCMDTKLIGAVLANVSGQVVLASISLVALLSMIPSRSFFDISEAKALFGGAAKLHLNTVGSFLLAQSTILMLSHLASKEDVGWYSLSYQTVSVLLIIPQSVTLVLYSRMAEAGPNGIWPEQKKIMIWVLAFLAVLSLVAYFAAPWLTLIAGDGFSPSVDLFRLLLPVLSGMSLAQLMTNQWIGRGFFLSTTILTLGTALLNILLNYFLIPQFGVKGAAWSMIGAYAGLAVIVQLIFAVWCEKEWRKGLRRERGKPSRTDVR